MTRPAKISGNSLEGVSNGNDGNHTRPMATEARPNPVILEDDNEGSTSKDTIGNNHYNDLLTFYCNKTKSRHSSQLYIYNFS